ncbi:MAG TPA: LysM domain-containing protein [Candidatus Saccharimonadales bacterium]|nr:LysM domain-containing protein [Candidatus Saccharimonadales bacterium]
MTVPPYVLVIVLIVFGFMTGATLYFYDQSRVATVNHTSSQKATFSGQIPAADAPTAQDQALTANTKPDATKGRLSYPTNVYIVQPHETLSAIGAKLQISRALIVKATGLTNENVIQAGYSLVIPALNHDTDYYRVNFTLNETVAADLNLQLRNQSSSDYFDPVKVATKSTVPYFGVTNQDSYTLADQDLSKGTAAVEVKRDGNRIAVVGLFQPKVKGAKGFWAILYIENQS